MKLVLHIGTHKTASSSLQKFLTAQRAELQKKGFFYPTPDSGTKNFNALAAQTAKGNFSLLNQTLKNAKECARRKNCHTVIISAESFYAMTHFFKQETRNKNTNYFDSESHIISEIHQACQIFDRIKIIAYFRPQDDFASSLYNQMVKRTLGTSDSYTEFLNKNSEIFNYNEHLELWSIHFGKQSIECINFNDVKTRVIEDFCDRVNDFANLTEDSFKPAHTAYHINTRLSRNHLEYKRVFNKIVTDAALHHIVSRILPKLSSAAFSQENKNDHIYASLDERENFFKPYEAGNQKFSKNFDIKSMETITKNEECSYKKDQLQQSTRVLTTALRSHISKPQIKIVLYLRRLINIVKHNIPISEYIFRPIRKYRSLLYHRSK